MRDAVLLFPPNWSACTYAPHLALPLLAGTAVPGWRIETWDLSADFYSLHASPPPRAQLLQAVRNEDFDLLDALYFAWEDEFQLASSTHKKSKFGLLSGFSFREYFHLSLREAAHRVMQGSVYTDYYARCVIPRLVATDPDLIGITVASQEQLLPALELLEHLRREVPHAFLVTGGNVITRLRDTSAFSVVTAMSDLTVTFQGETAFRRALELITAVGVAEARRATGTVLGDQQVPVNEWPTPSFKGIALDRIPGVPVLPYVSTRGCYWGKCSFCAIPAGWSSSGYAGSAPGELVAEQIRQMCGETNIRRVKFVDEAFPSGKVRQLTDSLLRLNFKIEWEAYARLEPSWEDTDLLEAAHAGGLRTLYFGLEQAPTASRSVFGKNDRGNPLRILERCKDVGIKVHLFCMVGHPRTSRADALSTVDFLLHNKSLIAAADLVGFRLDRGTTVAGALPNMDSVGDWVLSLPYQATDHESLSPTEVSALEQECQEVLWESCPRLLHPLCRIVGNWDDSSVATDDAQVVGSTLSCSVSSHSTA